MSTNYYLYGPCRECGHLQKLHIGQDSEGWYFNLHIIPGVIDTLDDWISRFEAEDTFILDEHGDSIMWQALRRIIKRMYVISAVQPDAETLRRNGAETGERGLMRFVVDGKHCIGHGEGPWSYIVGEFS